MKLANRIATLAAVGVVVAGLGQAGWFAGLWLVVNASSPVADLWLPVALQVGLTLVIAAAVGFGAHRQLAELRRSLALLEDQAAALEQGRFVLVEEPPCDEVATLSHRANAAVRQLQQTLATQPASPVDALRRCAPADPDTGVDSRFTFLRKLTERLADRQGPETALVVVRLLGERQPAGTDADPPPPEHTLAELLRTYPARVAGAFVGRLGERDFALCLPVHGEADETAGSLMAAIQVAPGRLRCVIAAADHLGGLSLGSTLAMVDAAIGRAEGAGVGHVECRSGRDGHPQAADTAMRKAIVDALRGAQVQLGEFPVLDAQGELLHLECPMRLRMPGSERYEPASAWLAVASRYRLMTQIDLTGLELALAACAGDGRARCVHVSAESLATAGFVSAVRSRLEAQPVAARQLWIEISEVSFERLPPRLRNAGTVWRRCGARVGIEHAGAALRSLVRVGDLDLDYVKVDAGFVQGVSADAGQRERAHALVAFAHEMGARVIAEGADDPGDLQALWELGFDGATGKAATQRWQHSDGTTAAAAQAMSPV